MLTYDERKKLKVGDKVGILPACDYEPFRVATVTNLTSKQIAVKYSVGGAEHKLRFMLESGRQIGAASRWRKCNLISVEDAKAREHARRQEVLRRQKIAQLRHVRWDVVPEETLDVVIKTLSDAGHKPEER